MICDQFETVVVPFPFTDRGASKRRPAVVLTNKTFNAAGRTVMAMITTTSETWPGDHPIKGLKQAGLNVECKVRLKLFTLDNQLIVRRLGSIAAAERKKLSNAWAVFGIRLEGGA